MDAVILAAGRGSRLGDLAQPFMKPLLKVFDEPLVVRAVRLAAAHVERPIVVVAPDNADAIVATLEEHKLEFVPLIQPSSRGPGHALLCGLSACRSDDDKTLVMIGTDLSSADDVAAVVATPSCVGIRFYNRFEAERFTYFDPLDQEWYEKRTPRTAAMLIPCWVGMFVGVTSTMRQTLTYQLHTRPESIELPIGPYLREFMVDGRNRLVPVSSRPIKTRADYVEVVNE